MVELFNPPNVSPPFSRYSQGALVGPGLRWLHISGQVGVRPDGGSLSGIEAQMHQAWDNLLAVLAAGAGLPDDVSASPRAYRARCVRLNGRKPT